MKKAGCILLDKKNKKIGLVYRQKQRDYSFPKGHLEKDESIHECAIRETLEETGRKCTIIPDIELPILEYRDSKGKKVEMHCFLAIDEGKSNIAFDPELVHEVVWVTIEEVENTLSYQNLIDFWNQIKSEIQVVLENE